MRDEEQNVQHLSHMKYSAGKVDNFKLLRFESLMTKSLFLIISIMLFSLENHSHIIRKVRNRTTVYYIQIQSNHTEKPTIDNIYCV